MEIIKTNEEVAARIEEMATEIIQKYKDKKPLFVCLLRGAAPFTAQLMTAITRHDPSFHPEVDYMTISTYGDSQIGKESRIVMDLSPSTIVAGRTVVVVDDILDKGITALFSEEHLKLKHAAQVDLVVLVQKDTHRKNDIAATIYGFDVPDRWIVGMGMDDARVAKEGSRWLDYIAIAD